MIYMHSIEVVVVYILVALTLTFEFLSMAEALSSDKELDPQTRPCKKPVRQCHFDPS